MCSHHGRIQAGRALRGLVQPPAQSRVSVRSDQAAEGFIPVVLGNLQGQKFTAAVSLSHCCTALLENKFLLIAGQNRSDFNFCLLPPSSCLAPPKRLAASLQLPPCLSWTGGGSGEQTLYSRCTLTSAEQRGIITSLNLLARLLLTRLRVLFAFLTGRTLLAPAELAVLIFSLLWGCIASVYVHPTATAVLFLPTLPPYFGQAFMHKSCILCSPHGTLQRGTGTESGHGGNCQNVNGALWRRDLSNNVRARSL